MDKTDWTGLLIRANAGDESSRQELFATLLVRLRPIVQSRLRGWSKADHDDILQNTLVVMTEKLREIDKNPQHYALNVLRNKIGDALRARQPGRMSSIQEEPGEDDRLSPGARLAADNPEPDALIDTAGLTKRIIDAIPKMSKFCQAFFLAALEGRTVHEVWELISRAEPGIKRSTFDKRIFDCRQRLRLEVQQYL